MRSPPRKGNLLLVAATGAMFLGGALLLTDWLRDREVAYQMRPEPAPALTVRTVPRDPRVEAFLGGRVEWGPSKPESFGVSPAVLVTAHDKRPPEKVFAAMLDGIYDAKAVRAMVREGPSAAVAMRMQATVGRMPSGAFLVRLVPDLEAARRGRLRTEPGAVTLAFPGPTGWQYVTWAFPAGLDLDALPGSLRAPPNALDGLDGAAEGVLEPVFALGSGGGAETIFCRAKGLTGMALERVASSLVQRGWTPRYGAEKNAHQVVRVLQRGRREVWLAAADSRMKDGIVSVILGSL